MKIVKIATLLFVGALFLALTSGRSAPVWANQHLKMQKDMKPVMPRAIQAALPTLTRVERTADGYALVGSGFGTDRTQVQAFEGSNPVPTTALISVTNDRVAVKSQASGTVQHKVVVAGRASSVVSFAHPTAQVTAKPGAALTKQPEIKMAQPAAQAPGATGIGVAKSPGPQEQVKAGALLGKDKPGLAPGIMGAGMQKAPDALQRSRQVSGPSFVGTQLQRSREVSGPSFVGTQLLRSRQVSGPSFVGTQLLRSREISGGNFIGTPNP